MNLYNFDFWYEVIMKRYLQTALFTLRDAEIWKNKECKAREAIVVLKARYISDDSDYIMRDDIPIVCSVKFELISPTNLVISVEADPKVWNSGLKKEIIIYGPVET